MRRGRSLCAFLCGLVGALLSGAPAFAQVSPYMTGTRYDASGQVVGTIGADPDGPGPLGRLAERRSYDANGWLIRVEAGVLAGWVDEAVLPLNWPGFSVRQSVESGYDVGGRKVIDRVIDRSVAGGVTTALTQYGYDLADRLVCSAVRMNPAVYASPPADPCAPGPAGAFGADRIGRSVYGLDGRVAAIQKGVGTALVQDYVRYSYSGNGQPLSVSDAGGNVARFDYDGFDRRVRWRFPDKAVVGQTSSSDYEDYAYDAGGNRTRLRKRDGSVISYSYDALNRLTQKGVPERAGVDPIHTRDVYYGYDNRGLQLFARFEGASGQGVSSVYDGLGRLASAVINLGGTVRSFGYAYDANGNRTGVRHADGVTFTYGYDALDRLIAVTRLG